MASVAFLQLGPARGAPAEIFTLPAPAVGADPPKARDVADGDATVATQTGALQYNYPIAVPPGRNGMAPRLALSYSSQGAIYGGIAAGWSLSVPEIKADTSRGWLVAHAPEVEVAQANPRVDDEFVSTFAGGQRLIKVTETAASDVYGTYRAQSDNSFARYERMNTNTGYFWRVRTTDGSVHYFGDTANTSGCTRISEHNAPPVSVKIDAA